MRTMISLSFVAVLVGIVWGQEPPKTEEAAHPTDAKSYHQFVETRLKHTYPATAVRMLRECGNVRDGICVDIGCGTGRLDVELAKRSNLQIVGLDINSEMKPFFENHVRQAGLEDRVRFVTGDAQQLPFPDDYADLIVSRGALIFIPDIAKCLTEVARVLKPTGVAFLGGRYLYAPQDKKMTSEELRRIVRESGVPGAEVIEQRGQWVKIIGPHAPALARKPQLGPSMLAGRCLADYGISEGNCLLVCGSDNDMIQEMQQGFLAMTEMKITALYPTQEIVDQARSRIDAAGQGARIACQLGRIDALPFPEASFDLVAGVGPVLIWSHRQQAMRELYRTLRPDGVALVGGRYLHMPASRKVSSERLRADAQETGIPSIRILDDMGQWVEIRNKGGSKQDAR